MANSQDSATDAAIGMLWRFFEAERRWPSRKEFLLLIDGAQLSIDSIRDSSEISFRAGSGDEVRPAFAALVTRPDVRELLAPVPVVLRQAASVFVAQALLVPDNRLPELHFREVKGHWSDASRAKMAFDVLRSTGSGFLVGGGSSGADPEDFWFSLSIDTLRYEHVQNLDDVIRVPRYPGVKDAGRFPSGQHLELLRRIYHASKLEQRWPRALGFALATRDVGYVPQLVSELRSRFIRGEFRPSQHDSLVLTSHALPLVDPSGQDRTLFVDAVRAIVEIWRTRSGSVEIPLADLVAALRVAPAMLGPVVAFLDWSKWCHAGHVNDDSHLHLVIVPGEPDLVLRNKNVRTFEDYMTLWETDEDESHAAILTGPAHVLIEDKGKRHAMLTSPSAQVAAGSAPAVAGAGGAERRAASDPRFRYDVAISFAGPQRALADALARAVRDAGFEVFYDDFYPETLWGKDLTVFFDEVFRKDSRYCVILVSKEYAERIWTTRERQSAMARAVDERGKEYILPIQVEPVEIPGLWPTIGYVPLGPRSIEEIAELLKKKLGST